MIWICDKNHKNQKIYILLLFEALVSAQKSLYGPSALFPLAPSVFVLHLYLYSYLYFYSYLYLYLCREIVIRSLRSPLTRTICILSAQTFIFSISYLAFSIFDIFNCPYFQPSSSDIWYCLYFRDLWLLMWIFWGPTRPWDH